VQELGDENTQLKLQLVKSHKKLAKAKKMLADTEESNALGEVGRQDFLQNNFVHIQTSLNRLEHTTTGTNETVMMGAARDRAEDNKRNDYERGLSMLTSSNGIPGSFTKPTRACKNVSGTEVTVNAIKDARTSAFALKIKATKTSKSVLSEPLNLVDICKTSESNVTASITKGGDFIGSVVFESDEDFRLFFNFVRMECEKAKGLDPSKPSQLEIMMTYNESEDRPTTLGNKLSAAMRDKELVPTVAMDPTKRSLEQQEQMAVKISRLIPDLGMAGSSKNAEMTPDMVQISSVAFLFFRGLTQEDIAPHCAGKGKGQVFKRVIKEDTYIKKFEDTVLELEKDNGAKRASRGRAMRLDRVIGLYERFCIPGSF
jgi:hypothetical protein